jgi:nucleoside-diphosphate-sugar epimerase
MFIFGLGYVSLGVANTLRRGGWTVSGTCRDEARARSLRDAGINAHVWRPDDGIGLDTDGWRALCASTHVLDSVPPVADFDRDPVLSDKACVDALVAKSRARGGGAGGAADDASPLRWVGYLSSTGVYGDFAGAWVDETTAVRPSSAKGKARDEAERAWRDLRVESGVPAFVFRLGGIYGPGRSVLDAVAAKHAAGVAPATAASKAERGTRKFISRVHVADIVNVLFASVNKVAERGGYGGETEEEDTVYNVVDDEPAPRGDAAAYARSLLGIEEFEENDADATEDEVAEAAGTASPSRRSGEEKRVRNARAKTSLGVELLFPTYREGLAAIAGGDKTPFD